jgi:glycosyltransferase involved in cell wall biosynthesis
MSESWNNIIEPILKKFNPKNIIEIGTNGLYMCDLINYCLKNDGFLFCIAKSQSYHFKYMENNFSKVYKPHIDSFENLLNLNSDLIFINSDTNELEIFKFLKELNRRNKSFPIIIFQTFHLENDNNEIVQDGTSNVDNQLNKNERNINKASLYQNNILHEIEKFMNSSDGNSKRLVFYKENYLNGWGFVFSEDNYEKFKEITLFEKERELYEKIEKLEKNIEKKNKVISEKNNLIKLYSHSISWKITKPLRIVNKIMKNLVFNPFLFIILKSNFHFKQMLHHIKAYNLLKKAPFLFDENFYVKKYPNIKKFRFSPLIHYMYYGYREGKLPNKNYQIDNFKIEGKNEINPLIHKVLFDKDIKKEIEYKQGNIKNNESFLYKLQKERKFRKNLKISIKVPAYDKKSAFSWGDYHFALSLKREFEKKDHKTKIDFRKDWDKKDNYDIALVLRGLYEYTPQKNQINFMWNISHPDLVSIKEYNSHDHVFIASEVFTKKLKKILKVPVTSLLQCTDPILFFPEFLEEYEYELLFVGNSRGIFRQIIKDLIPTKRKLGLFGNGWNHFLPEELISGDHIPNNELNKAYSSCKILLNDHWEDMGKNGFISNRIFDGFAAGAFIISDNVKGIEFLEDSLVTYGTPNELETLIDYYLTNDEERLKKSEAGRNIVLSNHTFEKRVEEILNIIDSLKSE